jgi:hypothetical protein
LSAGTLRTPIKNEQDGTLHHQLTLDALHTFKFEDQLRHQPQASPNTLPWIRRFANPAQRLSW